MAELAASDRQLEAEVGLGLGRIVALLPPLIHFIPDLLKYSVPLFLKRQCDRSLRAGRGHLDEVAGGATLLDLGDCGVRSHCRFRNRGTD